MGEVEKLAYYVPVSVLGVDEDTGRIRYVLCPCCSDKAYVDDDGRVTCALSEVMRRLLADAWRLFQ